MENKEADEKDKAKAKKLLNFTFHMLTRTLLMLVSSIGGSIVFAWGCMNEDWRAVAGGICLQFIGAIFSKKDLNVMLEQRVAFLENRLNITKADAAIQDVLKDDV